jgi:hypothetical protein
MSTPNPFDFPIVITASGLQPQSPSSLQQQVLAAAALQSPGYTANLPGSLVEDLSSTSVAAIAQCDSAKVEAVNSLTPLGANVALLLQLGQMLGVVYGTATNTSVNVVFTGTVGYVIPNGLLISDGTNAYAISGGGVIGSSGSSAAITAVAVNQGSFGVPANTVTTISTSIPPTITLSVTNPNPGTPGGADETYYAYRARVLQANLAACVSGPRFIKTMIGLVLGAQANLISVQAASGGLRIVVGGGLSTYSIAYAIFISVADVSTLQGSAVSSGRNVTVSLKDYPDTYNVLYVASPAQVVTMTVTWNTVLSNFTGGSAFPGLVQAPLAAYINALGVGQVINELEMFEIFQAAVEDVLDGSYLTRLSFSVYINGTLTAPGSGTFAITGDAESYFTCVTTGITVTQG